MLVAACLLSTPPHSTPRTYHDPNSPATGGRTMPQFRFSKRSLQRMEGIHPDLVSVMNLAIQRSPVDFTVLEGLRSVERQRKLVQRGASKTMNSRHLTGHAIDIAPLDGGEVSWAWPLYYELEPVVKRAARELGVDLEWGGDWKSFKDGPHWQLSWDTYGKDDMTPRAVAQEPARPDVDPEDPKVKSNAWAALLALLARIFGGSRG